MEALGQIAGGVAHDLNNGLTVILADGEVIAATAEDDSTVQMAEDVVAAAERAARLTRQLLALARRDVVQVRPLDLDGLLQEFVRVLTRTLPATIQVGYVREGPPPVVEADPDQLHQALLNLAVNARDAMPDGGLLRLRVETRDDDVLVEIADDGHGMDPETQHRALEPFFTTKGLGRGTGLGLANVAEMVRRLEGRLELKSELGRGTRVRLLLPRSAKTPADPTTALAATDVSGARILVADDDIQVRAAMCSALADAGFEVVEATNGEEVLRLVEASPPRLVVMDAVMPGMNGAELLRRLRLRSPALPVIVCSGYAPDAALHEDGIPFVAKPFRRATLVEAVQRTLADGPSPG
jgi:CheY-like chemotaxis protein